MKFVIALVAAAGLFAAASTAAVAGPCGSVTKDTPAPTVGA